MIHSFWLNLVQVFCRQPNSWVQQSLHIQKTVLLQLSPTPARPFSSFSYLFLYSPRVLWERWYRCHLCGWALPWHLLSVYWPLVSFCITNHLVNKEKSLLCLRVMAIYEYRDTELGGSIILCLPTRIIVVGLPQGPTTASWPVLQ